MAMEGERLIPILLICLCYSPVFKGVYDMVLSSVEAAVEAAEERTTIEVAEHEQEAANQRRDGGGGRGGQWRQRKGGCGVHSSEGSGEGRV